MSKYHTLSGVCIFEMKFIFANNFDTFIGTLTLTINTFSFHIVMFFEEFLLFVVSKVRSSKFNAFHCISKQDVATRLKIVIFSDSFW